MNKDKNFQIQIKEKIKKLVNKINHWNYLYYNLNNSTVSDQIYDQHFQELKDLEKKYPKLIIANTPTKKVGNRITSKFAKIQHHEPMLSLNNAFNQKDIYAFDKRINKIAKNNNYTYYCEPKIDGLPVSLVFKNNFFVSAATRGDGLVGENVTKNVATIFSIKENLFKKQKLNNFIIRGEVFFTKKDFQELNNSLLKKKEEEFILKIEQKQKDLKKLISHHLGKHNFFFNNDVDLSRLLDKDIAVFDEKNFSFSKSYQLGKRCSVKWKLFLIKNNSFSSEQITDFFKKQKQFILEKTSIKNNFLILNLKFGINFNFNEFSNPRNAASGTLKQLNFQITASRKLSIIFYNLISLDSDDNTSQQDIINNLNSMFFPTSKYNLFCQNIGEVLNYIEKNKKNREQIPYETDGVVIKLNEKKFYPLIESSQRAPGHSIAYKYPSLKAETQIINIFPTVGRTGKITYNAKLKKIFLSGSYISAATLHNAEYIEKKDIRINDFVFIIKAGEIIPKVIEVNKEKRFFDNPKWKRDEICPACKNNLIIFTSGVDQFCINENCSDRKLKSFIHFASRDAMNIVGFNVKTIKKFINCNFLKTFIDIYFLKNKYELILNLTKKDKSLNLGIKSIQNLFTQIEKSKTNSLERFLFSLNIRHIGIRAAKILARKFKDITKLFKITTEELTVIDGFGPILVESIVNFFSKEENINLILELKKIGLNTNFLSSVINNNFFQNKKVVITGTFEWSRKNLINKLENRGAEILNQVSKNTNFLLVGKEPGNKLPKAQELNINLIFIEELKKILFS